MFGFHLALVNLCEICGWPFEGQPDFHPGAKCYHFACAFEGMRETRERILEEKNCPDKQSKEVDLTLTLH
jgi:hypothetical protein